MNPDHEAESVGAEYTLENDVLGASQIRPHLRRAADKVASRLRGQELLAGSVRVKLKTSGFKLHTRQAPLTVPTDSARRIFEAGLQLLPQFDLSVPMRLVGVAAFDLSSGETPRQTELFEESRHAKDRRLDHTLDALRGRFGEQAVRRGSELKDDKGPDSARKKASR